MIKLSVLGSLRVILKQFAVLTFLSVNSSDTLKFPEGPKPPQRAPPQHGDHSTLHVCTPTATQTITQGGQGSHSKYFHSKKGISKSS